MAHYSLLWQLVSKFPLTSLIAWGQMPLFSTFCCEREQSLISCATTTNCILFWFTVVCCLSRQIHKRIVSLSSLFFLNNWTLRFVWFAGNLIVITILCVCVLPLYHKELVVAPPESVSACSLTASSSFSMLRFFYSFRVGRQSILRAAANKSEAPIWPGPPPISSNAFLRLLFCLRIVLAWLFPLISIMQSLQIDIRGNLDRNALT